LQIDPKEYEELELSAFKEARQRKYGSTVLIFFSARQESGLTE
jgi:hypothetical protein